MESAMVGTVPTIERSETVEVTRNGTTYEQKSQESQYRDPKPILDKENNPLNGDTAELYLRNRAFLQRHINTLNEIDREVKKLIADKDIAIAFVNPSSFHSDFMNLKGVLQNGLLHALCPYCFQYTGEECPACRKTGMLSKLSYDSAPEDWRMKDGVRMAAEPKPIENDEDF
jgi:hypothetical protein